MGAFNITIKGFGPHHGRNNPYDANRIAQAFVHALKANGCDISLAEFQITGGEAEDLRAIDYSAKFDDTPRDFLTSLKVSSGAEPDVTALEVALAASNVDQVVAIAPESTTEGNAGASTPAAPTDAVAPPAIADSEAPPAEGIEPLEPEGDPEEVKEVKLDDGLAAPGT